MPWTLVRVPAAVSHFFCEYFCQYFKAVYVRFRGDGIKFLLKSKLFRHESKRMAKSGGFTLDYFQLYFT